MKWNIYIGKLARIPLYLNITFLIVLLWVFISGISQGQSRSEALEGVALIVLLFACVLMHEYGHALTARRYGIETKHITLLPIGGIAEMERMPEKPIQELLVALAGPAVNIGIAVVLFVWFKVSNTFPNLSEMSDIRQASLLFNLFAANLTLAVFNLIPAFPMDGGRVLRALLAMRMERAKATRVAAFIGQGLAVVFILLGLFYNVFLILIGIFIFLAAGAEAVMETSKSVMERYKVRDAMMKNYTTLDALTPLSTAVDMLLNGQDTAFLVMQNSEVVGILTQKNIIKALSERQDSVLVADVMEQGYIPVEASHPLQEVYSQMEAAERGMNPVFEDKKLVGIIDLENIKEFLLVNKARKQWGVNKI